MRHRSADSVYTCVNRCVGAGTSNVSANAAPFSGFGACVGAPCQRNVCKFCTCQWFWRAPAWSIKNAQVHLRETNGMSAKLHLSADLVTPTWNTVLAQLLTECLNVLHLSAGVPYTNVKETLCLRRCQQSVCYPYVNYFVGVGTNAAFANAAPVSGFGVHLLQPLCWCRYQRTVCQRFACQWVWRTPMWKTGLVQVPTVRKCCTCQRIWRTPTWNIVPAQVPRNVSKCRTCQRIWRTPRWNTVLVQAPPESPQMPHLSADLAYTYMKPIELSANGALVSGFGIHHRETLCWCRHQQTVFSKFALTYVKHCVGAGANGASANAAPVSAFGEHPRETLCWLPVSANLA